MNTGAVMGVWKKMGGRSHQQAPTKLTMSHFVKDAWSAMNVALAFQLASSSTATMIRTAVEDDDIELPLKKEKYSRLIEFCEKVDRLVDICNGRSPGTSKTYNEHFTPQNGRQIQEELLSILSFFSEWHLDNIDKQNDPSDRWTTEWSFLPEITWANLNGLVLGHVAMIQYYCIENGYTIVPRRTNTDPCENHFANCRQMGGGSTNSLDVTRARVADSNSSKLRDARRVESANNAQSPPMHNQQKKF
jgi:hypothetical protein